MNSKEEPPHIEGVNLDEYDLGPMLKRARTATFAPNWRSVLAADALVGVVMIALGFLVRLWLAIVGWAVIGMGAVYLFLVFRRFLQWRWLRREVGLH